MQPYVELDQVNWAKGMYMRTAAMAGTVVKLSRPLEGTGIECSMQLFNAIIEVVVTSAAEVLMISGHTNEIHPAEPSTQHKAGET